MSEFNYGGKQYYQICTRLNLAVPILSRKKVIFFYKLLPLLERLGQQISWLNQEKQTNILNS